MIGGLIGPSRACRRRRLRSRGPSLADATPVAGWIGDWPRRHQETLRDNVIVYADGTRGPDTSPRISPSRSTKLRAQRHRVEFPALQARPDLAVQPIVSGRYLDRLERRDGHWCFVERRVDPSRRRCEPTSASRFHGPVVVPAPGLRTEVLARRPGRRRVASAPGLKGGTSPRRTPVGLRLRGASSPSVEPAPVSADTKDGGPAARSCS